MARYALLLLLSLSLSGCGVSQLFGVNVESHATFATPPNHVNVVVTVRDGKEPVDHLDANAFQVSEDDVVLDNKKIDLTLLPKDEHTQELAVLLLDLSGPPSDSELARIRRGAAHFVEKVSVTQPIIVVAFDGNQRPREVARYSRVDRATERTVPELSAFLSEDSSRDAASALVSTIKGLSQELSEELPTFGTVVTVLRGPDLAGRTDIKDVKRAVDESGFSFYSLSPENRPFKELSVYGRSEQHTFATIDTLPMRLSDLGARVRSAAASHYVLSYCSPARSGERKLKVRVTVPGDDGSERNGSASSWFNSTGFQGGCDRSAPTPSSVHVAEVEPPQSNQTDANEPPPSPESATPNQEFDASSNDIVPPPDTGKYE